jgi:hypothetical protein
MSESDGTLSDFPVSRKWRQARWIRVGEEPKPDNGFFVFRKRFSRQPGCGTRGLC